METRWKKNTKKEQLENVEIAITAVPSHEFQYLTPRKGLKIYPVTFMWESSTGRGDITRSLIGHLTLKQLRRHVAFLAFIYVKGWTTGRRKKYISSS